jgi:hypothetical protein
VCASRGEELFSRLTNYLFQHRVDVKCRETQAQMRSKRRSRNTASVKEQNPALVRGIDMRRFSDTRCAPWSTSTSVRRHAYSDRN